MKWTMDGNNNYYERGVDFWVSKIIKKLRRPVFYDIGSNFGYYSIKYSSEFKVGYAFEPVSTTFKILNENIRQNGIKNVHPLNVGIADVNKETEINIYSTSGCNTIYERKIPVGHTVKKIGSELVKLKCLDDLITEQSLLPPSIIKIDVEGAELQVLKGSKRTISEHQPIVIFEYSQATSLDAGYDRRELLSFFNQDTYHVKGLDANEKNLELIPHEQFGHSEIGNVILYPRKYKALFV